MTDKELGQIYNEAYKAVYWTAFSLLKNEADAEDIVQDTFVALIESYDSIKDKSKVTSWLKKTAANKCLDRIKLAKTDTMDEEFFDNVEAVPEDFLPDSIVESEDARKIVMNIINNSLSDDIRRTLILFYFDDMSIKEIAGALGVPEGTVSRRLNFARNKIKKEVEKYEKDNNTKLYAMAIPFLSKLFIKEAEQVAFKPLPAALANLSASASAQASKAGTNIAKTAIKKGTDIMKTKVLIGSVAAVVVVGATVGITVGVLSKKNDTKQTETVITEESGTDGDVKGNPADNLAESSADNSGEREDYYKYFIITTSSLDNETRFVYDPNYSYEERDANIKGELIIPDGVTYFDLDSLSNVTKVVVPESCTELPRNCFSGFDSLEEVVLPDTMTTFWGYSFYRCPKLKKVVMPKSLKYLKAGDDFTDSGVTEIYFPAEVELEKYLSTSIGVFTSMPTGKDRTVYVVPGSWMDIHYEELYVDESSDMKNGVNTNMPKKAYWDGVHTN